MCSAKPLTLATILLDPDLGQVLHGRVLFADHQCQIKIALCGRSCVFHRTLPKYSSAIHTSTHAYIHTYCGRINIDNLFTDKLSTDDKKKKKENNPPLKGIHPMTKTSEKQT